MSLNPDDVHTIEGNCHCGNVAVRVGLTASLTSYTPRTCDCDFCTMHGATWLSDPKGWMKIKVTGENALERYRQGAEVADMLFCGKCGILVGACYEEGSDMFGVANARIFPEQFGAETDVSPKVLSAEEKTERWKQIWFGDVKIAQKSGI